MAILGEMDGGPAGFYIYGLHSLVSRLRSFFDVYVTYKQLKHEHMPGLSCPRGLYFSPRFARPLVQVSLERGKLSPSICVAKAGVERRTSHEPNRMLMRENKGFFSCAFGSAHVKYGFALGLRTKAATIKLASNK